MLRLTIGRVLLVAGLLIGLKSWWMTIQHVGDPSYLLISAFNKGETHAWYHAFRESLGDVASMVILLLTFFSNDRYRTPETWIICLIVMLGYYAPFWIGTPFNAELAAPHLKAELIHIGMAGFSLAGLIVARPKFWQTVLPIKKTSAQ